MSIEGHRVLVTGAAQGIGECVARHLAESGAVLHLVDIQEEKVTAVAQELGCTAGPVDIADPDSCRSMMAAALSHLGGLDALVNVAGIDCPYVSAREVDDAHWRRLVDVDLSGPWWVTAAALPHLTQKGGGRVIFISSIAGLSAIEGASPAYSAAKAGLIGLTIQLSLELEREGILVNTIVPGVIGTTGTPIPEDALEEFREQFPLGEGGPEPIARAVSYLLGPGGDWISGAVLNVSGGFIRGR